MAPYHSIKVQIGHIQLHITLISSNQPHFHLFVVMYTPFKTLQVHEFGSSFSPKGSIYPNISHIQSFLVNIGASIPVSSYPKCMNISLQELHITPYQSNMSLFHPIMAYQSNIYPILEHLVPFHPMYSIGNLLLNCSISLKQWQYMLNIAL